MVIFHRTRTNGAENPWDEEVYWTFEITFNWRALLFGFSAYDGIYAANIGPFAFIYFYNWDAR